MLNDFTILKGLKAPIVATLFLTERCNLTCRHCLGSYGRKGIPDDLSFEEWTRIVDNFKSYIIKIDVTGGEPLLSKVAFPLMHYIKKEKFCVMSVTTNGTSITNHTALLMSKLRPELQFARVSLDGANQEIHEYIRGRGTHRLVIRGIRHLRANDIPVVVIAMIHKKTTFQDVDEMYQLAEKLDFHIQYGSIFPVGEALKSWRLIFPAPESLDKLSQYILRKEKEGNSEDDVIEKLMNEGEYSLKRTLGRCSVGYKGISVMSNGMLNACYLLPLNISYEKLLSVWREDPFFKRIRDYQRKADLEICQKCKHRNVCLKTCIGAPFAVFGDFAAPSPYCILHHKNLELDEELVKPYIRILSRAGVSLDEYSFS